MPKLIVATKIPPLDRYLSENKELISRGFDIIALAFDNTARLVQSAAQEAVGKDISIAPPVIILSSTIGKGGVIEDTIYTLRAIGYRVVLLPGDATEESTQRLVKAVIALGVYDFIYDPYTGENVVFRILNPATLADIDLPYNEPSSDEEEFFKEKGSGSNQDSGFIKRLADKVIGSAQQFTETVENNVVQPRKRRGKLTVLLGTSNSFIGDWVKENFSDDIEVIGSVAEPDNYKQKTLELSPDICVLVREGELGGIATADHLAIWAAQNVQSVLFIVGVLDELGKNMATRAKDAGVNHIVTCQEGERIYGGELVYVITNIIKELQGAEQKTEVDSLSTTTRKTIGSLLQGAGIIGKAIKNSADATSEKAKRTTKKIKPKISVNKREGVSLEEKIDANFYVQNLKNPTTIVPGGLLAVVSPWRPGLAGRLAAHAVKILNEVEGGEIAYVGASKNSTGALWLDVPEDVLMMSDWRVPGSNYPIAKDNIRIYAVDPVKDLSPAIDNELWDLLKKARRTAAYTVIDFAGDISSAQKAAHQGRSVLLVIIPGNDPVELKISSHWVKNIMDGKQNVVTGIDLRGVAASIPEGLKPKVIIRNNPADALTTALMKNNDDEFIWN